MAETITYPAPIQGDIVWCWFPHDLIRPKPAPKPRPGIILRVYDRHEPGAPYLVHVSPGASQIKTVFPHELLIASREHPDEFHMAGLSYDTKFDLRRIATLDFTSEWFKPPPIPRFGPIPKLGTLHPATIARLLAAYRAAR